MKIEEMAIEMGVEESNLKTWLGMVAIYMQQGMSLDAAAERVHMFFHNMAIQLSKPRHERDFNFQAMCSGICEQVYNDLRSA